MLENMPSQMNAVCIHKVESNMSIFLTVVVI